MVWSEEKLHAWLRKRVAGLPRAGVVGSFGHDAAVLRGERGRTVLCADQTIEGVHYSSGTSPGKVGHKAAGRALSDLAATAAEPRALLLVVRARGEVSESWLRAAIAAVDRTGRAAGAALVGGDLALAPGPVELAVSAIGTLSGTKRSPGRDRVRTGDVLLLTGKVGGSGLGRHLRIEARIAEGRALFAAGARAMMDVSDGLARDLSRMAHASRVRIELSQVPVHRDARRAAHGSGRSALEHALHDGEDHELLAAMPARTWGRVGPSLQRRFPEILCIGRAQEGSGLWFGEGLGLPPGRWDGEGGFVHGG